MTTDEIVFHSYEEYRDHCFPETDDEKLKRWCSELVDNEITSDEFTSRVAKMITSRCKKILESKEAKNDKC